MFEKTSLNQEKSEFEKSVEKHELEIITKRQELRQMQEDVERQKVSLFAVRKATVVLIFALNLTSV